MNSIFDALKNAGVEVTEEGTKVNCKLPFLEPVTDDDYEKIDSIKDNWFVITDEELEGYECSIGENIHQLLLRQSNKIKVVEGNFSFECFSPLYFYFEYQPLVKRFLLHCEKYRFNEICEENGIPVKDLSYCTGNKRTEAIAFYLASMCEDIILYINKADSIMSFPDISYLFEDIQKDAVAMRYLKGYLSSVKYPPNPKKKYFIRCNFTYDIFPHEYYYLQKE